MAMRGFFPSWETEKLQKMPVHFKTTSDVRGRLHFENDPLKKNPEASRWGGIACAATTLREKTSFSPRYAILTTVELKNDCGIITPDIFPKNYTTKNDDKWRREHLIRLTREFSCIFFLLIPGKIELEIVSAQSCDWKMAFSFQRPSFWIFLRASSSNETIIFNSDSIISW